MRTEIFGRSRGRAEEHGRRGCGYLGKIVSYPGGRYEEAGEVFLDLADPHCMLVLGKRGTGKSYTLGVLLEGFSLLEERARKRLAVLVVDTMSVFHSLKSPNTNTGEVERMKDFVGLSPRGLENVRIALPAIAERRLMEMGRAPYKDLGLCISPREVSSHMWLRLFDLKASEPLGSLLLKVLRDVRRKKEWKMADLKEEVGASSARAEEKRGLLALLEMAEDTDLFSASPPELVKPGTVTVLDISYLGRIGGLDLRAFIVAHLAETLLRERTLQTTVEMQRQAGLFAHEEGGAEKDTSTREKTGPASVGFAHETEGFKKGRPEESDIPLVWLVIDEAHLFLPAGGRSIASQPLIDWIKLGRHPGLSIILATQEPSALHDTAIRQADLVLSHQITAEPDIIALGKARQSFMTGDRDLPTMVSKMDGRRGLAIVFDDRTRKLEYCMVRPRITLHTGMDASALE